MAVIHPDDRFASSTQRPAERGQKLHPAIGLLVGFGFIIGVSALVHFLFYITV